MNQTTAGALTPATIPAYFASVEGGSTAWQSRTRENIRTRYCVWPGQSPDGRKRGSRTGNAKPWEGASDQRTFIVDGLIASDAAMLTVALARANVDAVPVAGDDIERASLVSRFTRWLLQRGIPHFFTEAKILANTVLTHGVGVMSIAWRREVIHQPIRLARSEILRMGNSSEEQGQKDEGKGQRAESAPDLIPSTWSTDPSGDFLSAIDDPAREAEARALLSLAFPDATTAELTAAVRDLRPRDGVADPTATLYRAEEVANQPTVRALTVGTDIFFPPETDDLEQAPAVFEVQWLTREELEARRDDQNWDAEWTERVIATALKTPDLRDDDAARLLASPGSETLKARVICAYYRSRDEHTGRAQTRYCVFAADAPDAGCALDEVFAYTHSRYPYVVFTRDRETRRILESRGMAEIGQSAQDEIKLQRDGRADHTELAHLPPLYHPLDGAPAAWGPMAFVPRRRGDQTPYEYVKVPPPPAGSIEVEQTLLANLDKRFGNAGADGEGGRAWLKQELVNEWLRSMAQVAAHAFALWNAYGPEDIFFRVVGDESRSPARLVRGSKQERYDFFLSFTVDLLDPKSAETRLNKLGEALARYDRQGLVNWGAFLRMLANTYDPATADKLIMSRDDAAEQEFARAKQDLTQIWAGMDVDFPDIGRDPDTAAQVLQEYLAGSEQIPANDVQTRFANDEAFRARLEKYQKQIRFQQQQHENAQTGRLGAAAGNMSE